MRRKEIRPLVKVLSEGKKIMVINREVSKTVKDASGKDFKRTAKISFAIPEKLDDLAGLVVSFGSVEKLASAAFYGVWRKAQLDATNDLMKGDKASKALKKMVAGLRAVMPTITDEQATQMVLSNPAMADAFKAEPMTAEITVNVNPASADFKFPALNDEAGEETEDDEKEEVAA